MVANRHYCGSRSGVKGEVEFWIPADRDAVIPNQRHVSFFDDIHAQFSGRSIANLFKSEERPSMLLNFPQTSSSARS